MNLDNQMRQFHSNCCSCLPELDFLSEALSTSLAFRGARRSGGMADVLIFARQEVAVSERVVKKKWDIRPYGNLIIKQYIKCDSKVKRSSV